MSVADDLKNMTAEEIAAKSKERLKNTERQRREVQRELDAEEYGHTAEPEILTLRERLAQPRPAVRYRIAQLQAVGHRVLLAAQFKAGKTTVAANVARSLLDGDAFLDRYDVAALDGVVVLFDFEMSPTQLDDWYDAQKIANDDRLLVIPMRGVAAAFNIIDRDSRSRWAERLKARGVQYLILDCLRPVFDALGLNEHTEAGLFLTALDALLREAEIPEALVIQHMGHKNERARGDSRLLDWPDVGWTLVRQADDDPASPRFFKAYGRDVDVAEVQLAYDQKTRRLSVVDADEGGVTRAGAKVAAATTAVCTLLADVDMAQSRTHIEETLKLQGHTRDAIRKALRHAVEIGALITEEGGRGGGFKYRSTMGQRPTHVLGLGNSASPPNSAKTPPAE